MTNAKTHRWTFICWAVVMSAAARGLSADRAAAQPGENTSRPNILDGHFASATPNAAAAAMPTGTRMNGYIGFWYGLGSAYSGGLGTYTPHHIPMAVYSAAADKTFFVWGGTTEGNDHLVMMVSYYDHKTGMVPRPVVVRDCLDKGVGFRDAHANPTVCIDAKGHVWVFCAARHSFAGQIYRSVAPLDINQFEMVWDGYIPYPQPWHFEGRGFLLMYTKYTGGRETYWRTSDDGRTWAKEQKLAKGGHYQASCTWKGRLLDALDWHPGGNSDNRTNLYFVQSDDMGKTWTTAEGKAVTTPLTFPDNPALVKDYKADGRYVFLNDITADAEGRPLIFYITSASGAYGRGPKGDPRWWTVAHWTGKAWTFSEVTKVDHNYDLGGIYAEADGTWRIIGPGGPGPVPEHTGGEMAMWTSKDHGKTWTKAADLTAASPRNHSFARSPMNAHPDFYAFWADGDALKRSESHLYFATRAGKVFRLPRRFEGDSATPEPLKPSAAKAQAISPADLSPPRAVRFQENPIIRPEMLASGDGDNINGPSLIAVPSWGDRRSGQVTFVATSDNVVDFAPSKAAASQPKTGEAAASQPGGSSRERILAVMRKVNAQEAARKSADRNWIGGTYYTGVMALYRASEEPAVLEQAVAWAEKNQWEPGTEGQYSANSLTCGQTYLELYFLKRDETRIAKIRAFVDAQVEAAMKQKKSAGWGYIDTLYVGPPTIAMLGELSGERKYYDFLDKMFWATAESLLDKETGLFYRDRGYIGKQTERGKKILWSRGNGWAIAGTARVLQHMPKEHPTRARYVELLRTLAASLAKVQGEDGLWRSNLADAEQFPNPETSGSAFFCYAMAWGVNQGLLDKATYLPVIARTWRGLVACVQPDGRLGFAQAVGAAPAAAGPKSTFPYATGLFLLAGSEVLKLAEELDQAGAAK